MAFPATPIVGKLARIANGGTNIDHTSRWTVNWVKDSVVYGRQGQEYKEAVPGQASWTGSAEMVFIRSSEQSSLIAFAISSNATPALTTGVSASSFAFTFDTTLNRLSGDIIVTGFNVDAPVGDIIRCTFNFTGSGPIIFKDA